MKDTNYRQIIKLDQKHCGKEVLNALRKEQLGLDVLDESSEMMKIESHGITFSLNSHNFSKNEFKIIRSQYVFRR